MALLMTCKYFLQKIVKEPYTWRVLRRKKLTRLLLICWFLSCLSINHSISPSNQSDSTPVLSRLSLAFFITVWKSTKACDTLAVKELTFYWDYLHLLFRHPLCLLPRWLLGKTLWRRGLDLRWPGWEGEGGAPKHLPVATKIKVNHHTIGRDHFTLNSVWLLCRRLQLWNAQKYYNCLWYWSNGRFDNRLRTCVRMPTSSSMLTHLTEMNMQDV